MRPLLSSNYTGTSNYPELIGARIVSVIYSVGFLFTNVDASFFFLLSFFLPSLSARIEPIRRGRKNIRRKGSINSSELLERRGATISRIGEREREKLFDRRRSSRQGEGRVIHYQDISFRRGCCAGGGWRSVVLVEKVIKVLSRCATRHENETRLAVVVTAIYTVR